MSREAADCRFSSCLFSLVFYWQFCFMPDPAHLHACSHLYHRCPSLSDSIFSDSPQYAVYIFAIFSEKQHISHFLYICCFQSPLQPSINSISSIYLKFAVFFHSPGIIILWHLPEKTAFLPILRYMLFLCFTFRQEKQHFPP